MQSDGDRVSFRLLQLYWGHVTLGCLPGEDYCRFVAAVFFFFKGSSVCMGVLLAPWCVHCMHA